MTDPIIKLGKVNNILTVRYQYLRLPVIVFTSSPFALCRRPSRLEGVATRAGPLDLLLPTFLVGPLLSTFFAGLKTVGAWSGHLFGLRNLGGPPHFVLREQF